MAEKHSGNCYDDYLKRNNNNQKIIDLAETIV